MRYHERTKHHFARFAPGPGQLDWANQPDPFRRFEGAPLTRLPLLAPDDEPRAPPYDSLYAPGAVRERAARLARAVAALRVRALALGVEAGGRRALGAARESIERQPASRPRATSSSVHFASWERAGTFPLRAAITRSSAAPTARASSIRLSHAACPRARSSSGSSSVYWREAWKYGERAFRYCQHDAGHAIGALRIAAATLGWSARLLDDVSDEIIEALLGLDRADDFEGAERESAELLMAVWPGRATTNVSTLEIHAVQELKAQRWYGKANRLSRDDPVPWEIIDTVVGGVAKAVISSGRDHPPAAQPSRVRRGHLDSGRAPLPDARPRDAAAKRRGARPMPGPRSPGQPAIHLALLRAPRRRHRARPVRARARSGDGGAAESGDASEFVMGDAAGCPADLPLFLLESGDARRARDAGLLPAGHRRRRRLLARHDRRSTARTWSRTGPRSTGGSSGKRARSARCSTSKPRRPACARPGSAASSTTRCTRLSASRHRVPVALPLHRRRRGG